MDSPLNMKLPASGVQRTGSYAMDLTVATPRLAIELLSLSDLFEPFVPSARHSGIESSALFSGLERVAAQSLIERAEQARLQAQARAQDQAKKQAQQARPQIPTRSRKAAETQRLLQNPQIRSALERLAKP